MKEKAVIVLSDMVTAYGWGTDACWNNIIGNKTAVSTLSRFKTNAFSSGCAATIDGLKYHQKGSLVMQMLGPLLHKAKAAIPEDAKLILATTLGEIDLLEKEILEGGRDLSSSNLLCLLEKVYTIANIKDKGMIVSAACASPSAAVAIAAARIRNGLSDCILLSACDSVTEFVFSGFSSLLALDKKAARPFDKERCGLSLGEGAAFALIMSGSRARREKREIIGEVAGWGMSDDAHHMTGPCQNSEGMVIAIKKALKSAGIDEDGISFIAAHGTGTVYNDAMEMKAFQAVFKHKKPVYSIKGGTGHTLGAAGLIEMIIAMRALREKNTPPTVNLKQADDDALGWVSSKRCYIGENAPMALMTNAGFGGINAALVIR